MGWHPGWCPVCREEKQVGYVTCLKLELCIDCFWDWQNGEIEIKQAFQFSKN